MGKSTPETRKQRMYTAIDRLDAVLRRLEKAHWEYVTSARPLEKEDGLSHISYSMRSWPIPDPDSVIMNTVRKLQQTKEDT
jgi:hypothetical protein|tara:strand:- start:469 stop:711 length:243 start_codon:yes stop_codon:yes gene_type:complete